MNELENEFVIDFNKFEALKRIAINRYGKDGSIYSYLFMYALTDEEEALINKIKKEAKSDNAAAMSRVELCDGTIITLSHIKVYGKVDYNDADDRKVLKELLAKDIHDTQCIPREYNFESNTSISKGKFIQYVETSDYIKAFKYYVSRIGKPEKIIIVKLSKNEIEKQS